MHTLDHVTYIWKLKGSIKFSGLIYLKIYTNLPTYSVKNFFRYQPLDKCINGWANQFRTQFARILGFCKKARYKTYQKRD